MKPGPVSQIRITDTTDTTIALTWMVSGDILIDRFEVTYNYTVNRCTAPQSANVTDTISDGTARRHTLESLNEDSTYRITVTAINDQGSTMSTTTACTDTSSNTNIKVMKQF